MADYSDFSPFVSAAPTVKVLLMPWGPIAPALAPVPQRPLAGQLWPRPALASRPSVQIAYPNEALHWFLGGA